MYKRVGLETPRGSGTSGYIQTNKFLVKSKTGKAAHHTKRLQASKPNIDMVEHNRKRKIYAKLFEFEDKTFRTWLF
ncbi:hypothetical protein P3X46_014201 [Hevea brasiliensis]|uniref:CWF21 domain-containing protein n=2 Tax=Hevea brasiliensis TaxID=3981 RepID=A0ABQ9M5W0_HEVBR|nr:hypothetical protein P3X46_014201 [Hevea brasiliensis]